MIINNIFHRILYFLRMISISFIFLLTFTRATFCFIFYLLALTIIGMIWFLFCYGYILFITLMFFILWRRNSFTNEYMILSRVWYLFISLIIAIIVIVIDIWLIIFLILNYTYIIITHVVVIISICGLPLILLLVFSLFL